jgi:glycosyltransferase involved in cell wall biosynthesis
MPEYRPVNADETTPEIWRRIFYAPPCTDLRSAFSSPDDPAFKNWTRTFGKREWGPRAGLLGPVLRVGMVVNPDVRCGIREHAKYFQEHLETECVVLSQDPAGANYEQLVEQAISEGVSILHIQHEFSLFRDKEAFRKLLEHAKVKKIKVILDCHTSGDAETRLKDLKSWAKLATRVIVHSGVLAEDLAEFNPTQIPLAVPDEVLWAPELDELVLQGAPLIGSFGFLNEHKGFIEVAEAMGLVNFTHPGAKFILIGTHNYPWQDRVYTKLTQLPKNTKLIDRFMPIGEATRTMAACDLLVIPYKVHGRSQSGAVDTLSAANRPILTSDSSLFAHVPADCFAGRFPTSISTVELGKVLSSSLSVNLVPTSIRQARKRLVAARGSGLSKTYDRIYGGLSNV